MDENQYSNSTQVKMTQRRLLLPLTTVLLLLIFAFAAIIIKIEQNDHTKTSHNLITNSMRIFNDAIYDQSNCLSALTTVILRNPQLQQAVIDQDRQQLLAMYADIFLLLKQQHGITHFYFHLPNRTNLLRVHKPEIHGDLINRFTAVNAERTQKISSGIELGPLGTFTLRTVVPIRKDNLLIGYLELGKEIEDILANIHRKADIEIAVIINKNILDKKKWEAGMAMLNRTADWNHYAQEVMVYNSMPSYPAEFEPLLTNEQQENTYQEQINYRDGIWHGQVHPLKDVSGTDVGRLIIWHDHTAYHCFFTQLILKISLGSLLLFSALLIYVWIILRKTDSVILNQHVKLIAGKSELTKAHDEMAKLAATDALTGLANRRYAMQALGRLWSESEQNDQSLACMMIDADHFKVINDSHGHHAGDTVLCELATNLNHAVRTDDIVCRLGGDEFLIICPNTDKDGLLNIAQHIHAKISQLTVLVPGGAWHGSISVGLAVKTTAMSHPEDLIKCADKGVYAAKDAGRNCVRMSGCSDA